MAFELGKIRRSHVTMMSGPGGIVDFRADGGPVSAIVAGLEDWDETSGEGGSGSGQIIREERLEKKLSVKHFKQPPVTGESYYSKNTTFLKAYRFPDWLQCPKCQRIARSEKWADENYKAYLFCPECSGRSLKEKVFVVPVRFVLACKKGHLDDFPWDEFLTHKEECQHNNGFLLLKSEKTGISGLILSCPECGTSRSLDGLFTRKMISDNGIKCTGRRPWLNSYDDNKCDKKPRVLQRGASNLYFPLVKSAISIPPFTDQFKVILGEHWDKIANKTSYEEMLRYIRYIWDDSDFISKREEIGLNIDDFHKEFVKKLERINNSLESENEESDIKHGEYKQFISPVSHQGEENSEFETKKVDVPADLKKYFSSIVRVIRLREVRALYGFTRITPPVEDEIIFVPLSRQKKRWLPAIEVKGEGIFIDFDKSRLAQWETNPDLQKRALKVDKAWKEEFYNMHQLSATPFNVTPRFLLIHSFSHALMRRLSLECGYSSAALRERLYVSEGDDGMSGVLVYTSTTDSDGSLGGLQRLAEPHRIQGSIISAINDMEWCSSDPLCIHGMISLQESHSPASCHSCLFASETSCEHYNRFLDRATLVGLPDSSISGFFTELLEAE
ncbi:DUF1998 domain-containing protein [Methanospirillum sp.]|uniref:DUF1998 domain-containing protein n=2 Tax=Methanospirillum sp. TaxID=45200 RepID=UPI002BCE9766|nr:DUF1998 domain-containing protein [Methanospirillum sp.]HPP77529.1 DUF1998 domain-containing protein [Methanospirillum sp.]